MSVGLALVSDDLVRAAFGSKWEIAIVPLRLLAFAASIRSITPLLTYVLNVVDDARYAMWNCVLSAVVMPVCYVLASRWGVGGIALVWVVVFPVTRYPVFRRVFQRLDTSGKEYVRLLLPTVVSSSFMSFSVILFRVTLPSTFRPGLRLAFEVVIGLAAYAGAILIAYREHAREAYRLARLTFANVEQ
jgi:O-antigen/teichoic acid export membrane protein